MRQIYTCFPEGKHKVLTLSYDDGRTADRRLVGMLNKYGVKGTFHINSGLLGVEDRIAEDEVKALYSGHEVSVHTVNHPTIARSPREEVVQQILCDRQALERIVGYPVRGMSYPNGSYNQQILSMLPHLGIEYARVVGDHHTYQMPDDYLLWQSTCHHNDGAIKHAKEFVELHKTQYLYMLYIWGHSYEFDNDDNWEMMEEVYGILSGKEDIWYATNIEIVDYMKAAQALKFNVDCTQVMNGSNQSIWLEVNGEKKKINPGLHGL